MLRGAILVAGMLVAVSGADAQGTAMPDWSLSSICAHDSDPDACRLFEAEAWRSISGSWPVLPQDIRGKCATATAKLPLPSYRLLADCLEDEHIRRNTRYATTIPAPTPLPQRAPQPPPAAPAETPGSTGGAPTPPGFTPLNMPTTPPPVVVPAKP
jgi:hypothetical protein